MADITTEKLEGIRFNVAHIASVEVTSVSVTISEAHRRLHNLAHESRRELHAHIVNIDVEIQLADETSNEAVASSLGTALSSESDATAKLGVNVIEPPDVVTASSTVQGDPHFVDNKGGHFDFRGVTNKIYSMVSTPTIAANVRFEDDTFLMGGTCESCETKIVHGSFMKELYIMLTTDQNTTVKARFSASIPSRAPHSLLPGGELKVSTVVPSSEDIEVDNVKLHLERINKREARFTVSDSQFQLVAKSRMYPWADRNQR